MTELLGVGYHEFDANWIFEYDDESPSDSGLQPYYSIDRVVKDNDGMVQSRVQVHDEEYTVRLNYESSGIGALNHESCDLETIREFRITWQRVDDVGQCSGSFHIAPRAPDMEKEDGEPIRSAPDIVGVNVRAQGSNLRFDRYLPLFRAAIRSCNVSRRYWRDAHLHEDQYSNIQDAEVYVRMERGSTGELIGAEGVITRIANLLATDRSGYKKHIQDDRDIEGSYHTATVGDLRASELMDHHKWAKEAKHYYPRNPMAFSETHPMAHPKIGVSLQASKSDRTVYWSELDRIISELEEILLNILNWEGYPVRADDIGEFEHSPYITFDEYFDPEPSPRNRRLVADPTPAVQANQERIIFRHLADGLTDSDRDVLKFLVSDGGEVSPADIAEDTNWAIGTIRSAVDRLDDLVVHEYGSLELRSNYVAQEIVAVLNDIQNEATDALESLAERIREHTGKAVVSDDALTHWVDTHAVDVDDREEAQLELRVGTAFDDIHKASVSLTAGLYDWLRGGWGRDEFLNAWAILNVDGSTYEDRVGNIIHS